MPIIRLFLMVVIGKVTQTLEFPNKEERSRKLVELKGIERHTYVRIGDHSKVYAIADEDLSRETETKTSAVHFLRFELTSTMIEALKGDVLLFMGIDLEVYAYEECLSRTQQTSLLLDL